MFGAQSGAFPDDPDFNAEILGALWGAYDTMPDWEVNDGLTARDWGIPRFWIQAGLHDPDIVMARFDYAFDPKCGADVGTRWVWTRRTWSTLIDANEAAIEAAGVIQHSYTAPGDDHGIFEFDRVLRDRGQRRQAGRLARRAARRRTARRRPLRRLRNGLSEGGTMQQEVVLALLAKEPSHGYQLRARLRLALGPLGEALNDGQIYVTLTRLEKAGLVVSERAAGSPDRAERKVYGLTPDGQQRVAEWLAEVSWPKPDLAEFHLKLIAAAAAGLVRLRRG